ncbi:MAG TPA: helix-turn-helix domain-containing protein [Solirubrobacteraceae bacterium]|jgi:DNA-binding PucR family transcriptional regulator|nr:helix-turn-helix domain-containing protein [Solirubrobacteraceae bacterium]
MSELAALEAVTEAVESGAGLPEVVRAAAKALDASLAVADAWGATLAVAARSPAEERALLSQGKGVSSTPLRVGDTVVGTLHMRAVSSAGDGSAAEPSAQMRRLLVTMIASEVERVRAPERASETAAAELLRAILRREPIEREELLARAGELSLDIEAGASVIVARAHPQAPTDEGWRARVRAIAERGARAVVNRSIAALSEREGAGASGAEVLLLIPGGEDATAARAAEAVLREMEAGLAGYTFALGRSRIAEDPADLPRAAGEALLAANVAQGGSEEVALAFEQTGAYRLLLSAMSENPSELQRFYAETVEPLLAYDEQYETELVRTLATFLEADGNVAGTAQRLFTHRHTIYYRLERVRELSGLDVSSSDGREKLSLGLKAMRVLGISAAGGPASEAGAEGGRVPGRSGRRTR